MGYVNMEWVGLTGHWLVITMLYCFVTIWTHSQTPCSPIMMDYSSKIMHYIIEPKWPRISLKSFLKISDKWSGQDVCKTWSQLRFYGTKWRVLFVCKIFQVQISDSCRQLLRQHGSTSLQRSCGINAILNCSTELETLILWFLAYQSTYTLKILPTFLVC